MQIIKTYWKSISWAILVLFLSACSGEKLNRIELLHIQNIDKAIHFGLYFMFTFLMMHDLNNAKKKTLAFGKIIIYSIAVTVLYGGMMEFLQGFTRLHRTTDIYDFLANAGGSLTAVLLYKPIVSLLNRFASAFIRPRRNFFP